MEWLLQECILRIQGQGHAGVQGTILPGITRRSILELAASKGYSVEEGPVTLEEALKADEVFTSGTAVVVSPVGSLTHKGKKTQYGEPGVAGESLYPSQANLYMAYACSLVFAVMMDKWQTVSWRMCMLSCNEGHVQASYLGGGYECYNQGCSHFPYCMSGVNWSSDHIGGCCRTGGDRTLQCLDWCTTRKEPRFLWLGGACGVTV